MMDILLKPLLLTKARKIDACARPYVDGKLLDIGAGRCYIARELEKKKGVVPTCIDVSDFNQTDLKLLVYDGKRIPFPSDSFDCSLIAYVLHHCENQIDILKEAMRVTKGNIIIFEDTKVAPITKTMDVLANKFRGISVPLLFHDEPTWLSIFSDLGLEVVAAKRDVEKEWFYPFVTHTMFVVRKSAKSDPKGRG